MKKTIALAFLLLPLLSQAVASPRVIIERIEKTLAPGNFSARYHFKNTRADGTLTDYDIHIQARSSQLQHIEFIAPEREKGREVLRNADRMWTFVPSVGKVIKIEDRESFAGGDFSNADVLRVDWLNQYEPMLAKESDKQWIIDLTAKGKEASYAKMRLWVKKETGQPVQQEFFDSSNTTLKRLRYADVKKFGRISRPARLIMENLITTQTSELTIEELVLDQQIPEKRFVVDNLGK